MKKAFTLIELLVVIAIIAILAAILFPVFAQAKLAAKKAVSISNQKQLGLSLIMYTNDYDDMYPRNDGCTLNDSLVPSFNNQPAGTDPTPFCNGTGNSAGQGGFAFRDNDYDWGKWIQPYAKSVQLLYHPVIQPTPAGLAEGEIDGGYALNVAITGASNSWGNVVNGVPKKYQYETRTPWLGGSTTSVPGPADAWLIMEQISLDVAPAYEYNSNASGTSETLYPAAIQEHWLGYFYNNGTTDNSNCKATSTLDATAAPFSESVPLSYCDGHTKALPVGQFLANTPTASQYLAKGYSKYLCGFSTGFYGQGAPNLTLNYPFWGLGSSY